jgi:quercetin dioxygenase-like cupin family protein
VEEIMPTPTLSRRGFAGCALCAALGLVTGTATAQAPAPAATAGVTRTILQQTAFPGDRYMTILAVAEVAAGATVAWHTHPGVETAYVLEGEGDLMVRGAANRHVKAADTFQIAAETPHSLRNGDRVTRIASTYVVEKDKPLASPAPAPQ